MTGTFGAALATVLLVVAPVARPSTTWYVDGANGSDTNNCQSPSTACGTIGHAISLAASGDSIIVAVGVYPEHLTITVNLSVIGSGQGTIIDGQGTGRVVDISVATAFVTLSNLTIRHGRGTEGAGILNYGSLTLNNTTITGNLAAFWGGGVYNSGTLRVINTTLSDNSVSLTCPSGFCVANGGAIYSHQGAVTISNSTLNNNRAHVSCSTFANYATCQSFGGAVSGGPTMIISNSTIAGNTAQADCYRVCEAYGGGIWGGSVTISNSTLSGNGAVAKTVALGGAIYVGDAVIFQNSILADNPLGGNCSGTGTITSKGYNLSSDATCNFNKPGDLNNHDPLLGPLQNNGGPTQTMALLPGSPAIDGGNPSGCTDGQGNLLKTDQRGMPRPDKEDSGGCDIGAYETQSD